MTEVRCFPARVIALSLLVLAGSGCGDRAHLPVSAGTGPAPILPEPRRSLVPTVKIAPAQGWADGEQPTPAPGLSVNAFATGLDHPRWLYVLPNGDVLVAETNAPPRKVIGIRARIARWVMKRAGAGVPSANRISLLRDADGDGVAELRSILLDGLDSPFGMALVEDVLYVANTDAVISVPYRTDQTRIDASATKLIDLPAGEPNRHWTKSLLASADGVRLYVGVGSNSNVGENGLDREQGRAAIWEIDRATGAHRIHASGLRNPVGMAWEPGSSQLWVVVNERDELGSDLVPDYMTSVQSGGFYGWPYGYFGAHVDARVKPQRPDLIARAIVPDYALGPHTASLGLTFAERNRLPAQFSDGLFVGQHGSWNRAPRSGYRVVFVRFEDGRPRGMPVTVLDGFVDGDGRARGRPVGVAVDRRGDLLVADDVGNTVWRVTGIRP
ncbi:MAG: sorbosone dehydrogenase family protein [Burkholderiales bacterium]|nr:sorbosone dehydrogenase family protein [Burkholderiales bacterium]